MKKYSSIQTHCFSQKDNFCCRKKFTVTWRNILSQEEIYCHSQSKKFYSKEPKSCHNKKCSAKRRSLRTQSFCFVSQENIYCPRKKYNVTERNLLSQKEIYCCRKKYLGIGINFVELGRISSYKMNFLSKKEDYCHMKKFNVARRIFLS